MKSTPDLPSSRLPSRPIVRLLELLGRRWAMRIVWELRDGRRTSRSLRSMCDDASPGVVQARLNDLIGAGFVSKCTGGGYELTDRGRSLLTSFLPLYAFAERWGVEYPGKDDALEAAG